MKIKKSIIGFIVMILLIASSVYGLIFEAGVELFMTNGSVNVTYNFTNEVVFANNISITGFSVDFDGIDNVTLIPSNQSIYNGIFNWSESYNNFSMIGLNQTVSHIIAKDKINYSIIYDGEFISGDFTASSTLKYWRYGENITILSLNLSFGPDSTTIFRVTGCGPGIQNSSVFPENQNKTRGIDYVCNNGTISTNVSVKLIGTLNSGWPTIIIGNNSDYNASINLTNNQATPKTIWRMLGIDSCFYTWFNFTCNNATQNPGVYEQYNATGGT